MTERKYQLLKVKTSDYLLPDNDGQTLWRIATYEDGPSYGLVDWPRDRTFWGAWKYRGRVNWREEMNADQLDDLLDWNDWDGPWEEGLTTRREAIDSALKVASTIPRSVILSKTSRTPEDTPTEGAR